MSPPETVLAVDLGAKRVGAWMAGPNADDLPRQTAGALTDLDDGEQQWAQAGRRLLRGQSRRILRRKLAKRFLKIAADRALALALPDNSAVLARAVDQLMNRRGFIRRKRTPPGRRGALRKTPGRAEAKMESVQVRVSPSGGAE